MPLLSVIALRTKGVGAPTVTVKLQLVVVPQLSLAVQVTSVLPGGKVLPLGGVQVTLGVLQPPVAVVL